GIGIRRVILEKLDRLGRDAKHEFHPAALGLRRHLWHHRQPAFHARANHQALAFPGNFFVERHWRGTELLAKLSGRLLFALTHLAAIENQVLSVLLTVDFEPAKATLTPLHCC